VPSPLFVRRCPRRFFAGSTLSDVPVSSMIDIDAASPARVPSFTMRV
jgi:hypothetical protein